jgi:hypothetical protein
MIIPGPGRLKRDERRWIDLQKRAEFTNSSGKRKKRDQ